VSGHRELIVEHLVDILEDQASKRRLEGKTLESTSLGLASHQHSPSSPRGIVLDTEVTSGRDRDNMHLPAQKSRRS
ncbi:hypothetical protein HAX54_012200, partial [Datura stramonium]|nr:hypothetical protein [Datura stramonium]